MRPITCVLLCFSLLHSIVFAQIADSRSTPVVITHVNVIPMDSERVLEDQTVIIENGMISAIGKDLKSKKNAVVVNGKGKYLIPGLAEMHAHVPPIDDIAPMKDVLALFAYNGITTIRGMLGHPKHLELRQKIKNGEILGPTLYTTGPSFNGMSITSPEAGATAVRNQKAAGYDFLKLHPGLTRAKFDSIAATAHRVKIPFVGHVSSGVGIWRAIEAKYSSIDHLDGFIEGMVPGIETVSEKEMGLFGMFVASRADTSRIPELVAGLKKNNIWVVPTQSLAELWFSPSYEAESFRSDPHARYIDEKTIEQWISSKKSLQESDSYEPEKVEQFVRLRRRLIKACNDGGVGLLLGCDAPQVFNVPGFSTHQELVFMVRAGLTPYEALKTGTLNVAKYLNLPNAGHISKGAAADLVLLGGNPLADITQTKKIEGVMLHGKWLPKSYIIEELKKLEK
jgi:imidazolonepropionase-like amidohydrolase